MSNKSQECIARVLKNAALFIGTPYSREKRNRIWPGGSMDCSSYTAAIWSAAGFPLLDASGNELRTSTYQVNAVGFDLVYPGTRAQIGKNLPSPKGLLASIVKPGDIVFWNFDSSTTRKNKITHVGNIDIDGKQIIHTANNKEKCCRKALSYGDGNICAVIRLKDEFAYPSLPAIKKPTDSSGRPEEWQVRMLQAASNMHFGTKLELDGLYGTKTENAVLAINKSIFKPGKVCTADTWAALGLSGRGEVQPVPEPETGEWPVVLRLTTPYMRPDGLAQLQDGLTRLGYDCGTADGICGAKTLAGVKLFQAAPHGETV